MGFGIALSTLVAVGTSVGLGPGLGLIPPPVAPDAQLTAARVERHAFPELSRGEVKVDALSARVELHGLSSPQRAVSRLKRSPSALCPKVALEGKVVVLTCVTRRITASIGTFRGQPQLDLRATRGVPWAQRSSLVWYSPLDLGEGGACPGTTSAGRGECLLEKGDREAGMAELQLAARIDQSPLAHLRLGDLAWDAGDPNRALAHWAKTGPSGIASRLARIRECELSGVCLGAFDVSAGFDLTGLPDRVLRDVRVRLLRLTVFADQLAHALPQMQWSEGGTCTLDPSLCDSALLQSLQAPEGELRQAALAVYLQRPIPTEPPVRLALARAAAETSADLGAPLAAAQLLNSVMDDVPAAELDAHLLRTAQMFERGGDRIRAGVVRDFARARPGQKPSAAWREVGRSPRTQPAAHKGSRNGKNDPKSAAGDVDAAALQQELDHTRALLERAGNLTQP